MCCTLSCIHLELVQVIGCARLQSLKFSHRKNIFQLIRSPNFPVKRHEQKMDFNSFYYDNSNPTSTLAPSMATQQQYYSTYQDSANGMYYNYDSEDSASSQTQQSYNNYFNEGGAQMNTNCAVQVNSYCSESAEHAEIAEMGHQQSEESQQKKQLTTKWQRKRAFELTLPAHVRQKRRLAANARERKRMTSLNDAFERLREILPCHRDR